MSAAHAVQAALQAVTLLIALAMAAAAVHHRLRAAAFTAAALGVCAGAYLGAWAGTGHHPPAWAAALCFTGQAGVTVAYGRHVVAERGE